MEDYFRNPQFPRLVLLSVATAPVVALDVRTWALTDLQTGPHTAAGAIVTIRHFM